MSYSICLNPKDGEESAKSPPPPTDSGKKRMKLPNSGIGYMCDAMRNASYLSEADAQAEFARYEDDSDPAEGNATKTEKYSRLDPIYSRVWVKGDGFHYKYVILPQKNLVLPPRSMLSQESEWRGLGIDLPSGYALHQFESAQILLFRRPIAEYAGAERKRRKDDEDAGERRGVDPGIIKDAIAKASMSRPPVRPEAIIMALLLRDSKKRAAL